MADDGLFSGPEHTPPRTDGPWLVAPAPGCWRYMVLGEDGGLLLVEGHGIRDDELADVVRAVDPYTDVDAEWVDVTRRTWARGLCACPDHATPNDECARCAWFENYVDGRSAGPTWWEWSTQPGEPADANRGKPGYFPVTVIDLEG